MGRKIYLLPILILFFISCERSVRSSDQVHHVQKDSTIVFFDIKNYVRSDLSRFIKIISDLNPEVIALNVIFEQPGDPIVDSILVRSIASSGKVVLSVEMKSSDLAILGSHAMFAQSASGVGAISYLPERVDSIAKEYIPLFQNDTTQMPSFPLVIVYKYQPKKLVDFRDLRINKIEKINYTKTLHDFEILDENNLSEELIKGKIVIFDDFSSAGNYIIPGDKKRIGTNSSVVTANIILQRLSSN